MRKNSTTRWLAGALAAVVMIALVSLSGARPRFGQPRPAAGPGGLEFRLSEAQPSAEGTKRLPHPPATALGPDVVKRLLAELPALHVDVDDTQEFKVRPGSLPRPRTGETIQHAFPPAVPAPGGPPQAGSTLSVLRYAPEGNVPIVPQVSVTFSQPMVPVTSLAELAAGDVPVQIAPQPQGKWRWIGTRTLLFEPADNRMPMSTTYTVKVPAGTKDAAGHALAQDVKWTFTTPPPQVQWFTPQGGPTVRDPIMVAVFDQKIDPAAVLASVKVNPSTPLRLTTQAELDETSRARIQASQPGRAIAFRGTFPAHTGVTVTFGPGTPSLEGPNKSDRPQNFSFRTYGPMAVTQHGAGYGNEAPPGTPLFIRFSNPIEEARFKPEMVRLSPAIPNVKIEARGNQIWIYGRTRGRTTYTAALDTSIPDAFGQTLSKSEPLAFQIGSARPAMAAPGGNFIVADPFVAPGYTVFSINHPSLRVRMYQVTPDDWRAFAKTMQKIHDETFPTPPGRKIVDTTVQPKGQPDELTETTIDPRPALHEGLGNVVVTVEPTVQPKERWRRQYAIAWIQATRIGLDALVDGQRMSAWANRLTDGQPLADVSLSLTDDGGSVKTDKTGLAELPLPEKPAPHRLLVARQGSDIAFLPQNKYWWSGSDAWAKRPPYDAMRWYVFDDRGIYKPKESVHFKGWLRVLQRGPAGDIRGLEGAAKTVQYKVLDSRGNEVAKGSVAVNAAGGFDGSFSLPDNLNLGTARLQLTALESSVAANEFVHTFQVEEFRRPEFEVTATAPPGPYLIGDAAKVTTEAKYYAGGALGNADVTWNVTSQPGFYRPPGHDEFTFGTWVPWFWYEDSPTQSTSSSKQLGAKTDASGKHALRIDFDGVEPARPSAVTAEATVMDVNRQAWSSSAHLLVHPASEYVGLKRDRMFVQPGQPVAVSAIVTDIDGKISTGRPIALRVALLDWTYKDGQYRQVESHVQDTALTSGAQPVTATLQPKEGGTWRIRATVTDPQGRPNESEMLFWVAGRKQIPSREVKAERLLLVPDKEKYQPGDVAHVLVQAPFAPGHGVLTLSRNGLVQTRAFELGSGSATLDIPIEEQAIPNLELQVEVVGSAERTDDDGKTDKKRAQRPAFALGSLSLQVPALSRTLTVDAVARERAVKPGTRLAVDVSVKDAAGKPAQGEVALVVVDEAVLALTGYKLIDPVAVFYASRSGDVTAYHLRSDIMLANPQQAAPSGGELRQDRGRGNGHDEDDNVDGATGAEQPAPRTEAADEKAKQPSEPGKPAMKMRSDFSALALFAPAVATDASGHAVVWLKLPDNLTRYRVMAVGVSGGKQFGAGESNLVARLPLMVRPSAPRFLNFGDHLEMPVVLQNQTDRPMQVQVAMRATNVKFEQQGLQVDVPANDRVEIRFPGGTDQAGTARFQVAARCAQAADAAEFSLPVYTPATTEAFATYGVVDAKGAVAQPVKGPSNVYPQFGGLEIELSSTALQALTDAVLYLVRYPFECAEQVSSRMMGIAALRDVLSAFHAKGLPDAKALNESVAQDVEKLKKMQNDDGGFAFWRRGDPSWPYLSVHVTHALVRAKGKGYAIPDPMLERAKTYLRHIESRIPSWYPESVRNAIIAYSLNVRWRMGDADVARARKLVATGLPASTGNTPSREKLSVEAVGWLLPLLASQKASAEVATLERYLQNRVTETAGAASFRTAYEEAGAGAPEGAAQYLLLATDRRADAIVLEALVEADPKSDLIPKIVRGLLGHRSRGRWANTQENVFVLLALDRYFNTFEKTTPDFVARLWLGSDYAGEQAFRGRSTARYAINVPMKSVLEGAPQKDLVLDKQGAGRLYYRIGMQYAPRDLDLKPLEAGFTVQRTYEGVDDKQDVTRQADGSWLVKAGSRVKVKVTMVAPSRRYHVALVDPMPAGFEALNSALAAQGALPRDTERKSNPYWYWMRTWYEHQNLRDERAEAFTSLLWEGVYTYTYYTRATTPGTFVVPPPKAEEMYSPEVFGRGGTDRVVVR